MPAVTADGSRIFVPYSGEDGARGGANLIFMVWNRHGKEVQRQLVYDIQELDPYFTKGVPPATQMKNQELAAGKLLDELEHQGLQPMALDSTHQPTGDRDHYEYTAEGDHAPSLTIDLSPTGTLTVKPKDHAAVTRHRDSWRTAPSPEVARRLKAAWDKGENGCFNPAGLGVMWVDLSRRVVLVTISYHGSDSCWEPDHDITVVAW